MLASSVAFADGSMTGDETFLGAGTALGGGDDRKGEVGGAVVKVEELVVACRRAIGNLRDAISCVGAGSSTPLAFALISAISR